VLLAAERGGEREPNLSPKDQALVRRILPETSMYGGSIEGALGLGPGNPRERSTERGGAVVGGPGNPRSAGSGDYAFAPRILDKSRRMAERARRQTDDYRQSKGFFKKTKLFFWWCIGLLVLCDHFAVDDDFVLMFVPWKLFGGPRP
jgi:hypothetical protein